MTKKSKQWAIDRKKRNQDKLWRSANKGKVKK
jgi:hypothetical protein